MEKETPLKNYELKSDAVEALVDKNPQNVPQYSKEELEKYRTKKKFRIPDPVKILFLKVWFSGAVCFFIMWGLGTYVASLLDMLFILAVVQGLVTDLLLNNVIRFLERFPGEHDEWMLLPKKGMLSFFLNILYAFVIIFCVYLLYSLINYAINFFTGQSGNIYLGVEPILFGLFCMGFDMLFIGIKRMILGIIEDAKDSARGR